MSKSVMIVDDEPEIRTVISRYLTSNGLEAVAASGCEQCLEHLENGFKGVVLMDLIMPEMDGWDTIREIIKRGFGENAVIILLTASTDAPTPKSEELRQYVTDYIPKPADLKQFGRSGKKLSQIFWTKNRGMRPLTLYCGSDEIFIDALEKLKSFGQNIIK